MSISGIFSKLFSGIFGVILTIVLIWGEFGGIYHAFKHHSVADGFIAAFIPPMAWYRSVEFFFCKKRGGFLNLAKKTQRESAEGLPKFSADEIEMYSFVVAKSFREPLQNEDLKQLKWVLKKYHDRVGVRMSLNEVETFKKVMRTVCEYNAELGRCLLLSFDSKQPVISIRLKQLRSEMEKNGFTRKSKLKADFRKIESVAKDQPWTDEFGQKYYPLTRDEILDGLKMEEISKKNIDMVANVFEDFARVK